MLLLDVAICASLGEIAQSPFHDCHACMVNWANGTPGKLHAKTRQDFFSPFSGFSALSELSSYVLECHRLAFMEGGARQPGPGPPGVAVEVFNVGGWLTDGDFALETEVDCLIVVEHWLIPAGVRGEWSGLKAKGLASIWAPESQDSSNVGDAGVGVVSMRSAPVAVPTFATAQFSAS